MNPLLFAFGGIFAVMWVFSVIAGPQNKSPYEATSGNLSGNNSQQTTLILTEEAATGLDLEVLPTVLAQSESAEAFESNLNASNGPNNLDLNADGIVDFIKVTEFSNATEGSSETIYGYSLTVDVTETEEQEIAVIEVKQEGENANVLVSGNKQIYGNNANYSSSHSLGTFLMMAYFLSPHRPFFSPFGYGYYPSYYNSPRPLSTSAYRNQANRYKSTATARTSQSTSLKSPNANKSATSIKKGLRNPTSTQKAFQARNPTRSVGTGGFGNRSGTRTVQRGFGGNSVRNFASSRRSFGGSFGK